MLTTRDCKFRFCTLAVSTIQQNLDVDAKSIKYNIMIYVETRKYVFIYFLPKYIIIRVQQSHVLCLRNNNSLRVLQLFATKNIITTSFDLPFCSSTVTGYNDYCTFFILHCSDGHALVYLIDTFSRLADENTKLRILLCAS